MDCAEFLDQENKPTFCLPTLSGERESGREEQGERGHSLKLPSAAVWKRDGPHWDCPLFVLCDGSYNRLSLLFCYLPSDIPEY